MKYDVDELKDFMIWSWEHHAWWRPNKVGYTTFPEAAGRYTHAEASKICIDHIPAGEEVVIHELEASRLEYKMIVWK